jgi:hypothetical protein
MPHPSISGRAKEWKEQIHDTASDETLDDNESSSWEINTKEGRQQKKMLIPIMLFFECSEAATLPLLALQRLDYSCSCLLQKAVAFESVET